MNYELRINFIKQISEGIAPFGVKLLMLGGRNFLLLSLNRNFALPNENFIVYLHREHPYGLIHRSARTGREGNKDKTKSFHIKTIC